MLVEVNASKPGIFHHYDCSECGTNLTSGRVYITNSWKYCPVCGIPLYREMKHGNECFVLGNGPSLANVDISTLAKLPTFGSNRIYLKYVPTYYACVNVLMAQQSIGKIMTMNSIKFVTNQVPIPYTIPLYSNAGSFSYAPLQSIYEGGTVTVVLLQLALWLGFKKVYLLGVDHNYVNPAGNSNEEVIWNGEDVNHFSPSYMKEGEAWNCPDLYSSEQSYMMCKNAYEMAGASIINLTANSMLDIFEMRDLSSLVI